VFTKRVILNSVLGVGLVGGGVVSWSVLAHSSSAAAQTYTVSTAKKANVLSSVSGTGNVLAPSQVDVNFDSAVSSNKVTQILVKAGDKVTAGQVVAKIDDTTLQVALATAQAQLLAAQASYDKTAAGPTAATKTQDAAAATQASVSVQSAQSNLTTARANLDLDTTLQAQAVDQSNTNLAAAKAKAAQDLVNQQTVVDQAQAQLDADNTKLAAAQAAVPTNQTAIDAATAAVTKDTQSLASAKNQQASLVLSTQQSVTSAQNSYTNALNAQTSKLASDQQAIDNAARQLTTSQASYQSTLAGNASKEQMPTDADLAPLKSSLLNAQNSVTTAQRNVDNATLKAPAAGTIAAVNGKVGANASTTSSSGSGSGSSTAGFVVLADLNVLQVKVGFSEADSTKVKVGLGTQVTFDSIQNATFTGKVVQIDLTSTTVSSVVTYYAYVALDASDALAQVRPGMTASVTVVVQHADNVVSLPAAAVNARGTNATVNVEVGNDPKKTTPTQITVGLRGDSLTEITSGLKDGDKVVVVRQVASGVGTTGRTGATGAGTLTGGGAAVPGGGAVPGAGRGPGG
jgi:multidrug efflux pump subunit AcrA (membrane-fusion protein)